MILTPYFHDTKLAVKVIPRSGRTELKESNGQLVLYLKSPPEKDKANLELIRFFKREYGLRVTIVSGMKSRMKIVEVIK